MVSRAKGILLRQRAGSADEHMGLCGEQRGKVQVVFPDDLAQNGLVVVVQIEDADLTAQVSHVLDDFKWMQKEMQVFCGSGRNVFRPNENAFVP